MERVTMASLTKPSAEVLGLFEADKSAPGPVRAELVDWSQRQQACTDLLSQLRAAGDRARSELAAAKQAAPQRLAGVLATGKAAPELIATELPALRLAVDTAQDRYAVAERTLQVCEHELLTGVYRRNAEALLGWVASARAGLPWFEQIPAHLQAAWSAIGGRWQVQLPFEACERTGDSQGLLPYPNRLRLALQSGERNQQVPFDRHYWAWGCIADGQYELRQDKQPAVLRLTGNWEERLPLPQPSSSPEKRTRGLLGIAR